MRIQPPQRFTNDGARAGRRRSEHVAREAQIVASRNAATWAAGDHIYNLGTVSGRNHAVNGQYHWTKAT
jgi:hypothetical protein